jgi:hypothetical protein
MRKLLVITYMAVVFASVTGDVARTRAAFSDTATATSTFTTGTVDIQLSNNNEDCDAGGATYADSLAPFFTVNVPGPGNFAVQPLCLKNQGTLDFRWALSSTVTDNAVVSGALKAVTKIRIWSLNSTGSTAGTTCVQGFDAAGNAANISGTQTNFGAELYASGLMSTNPSFASSADTELAPNGYQKLCFALVLPDSVSDAALSGKTVTMNFSLAAGSL